MISRGGDSRFIDGFAGNAKEAQPVENRDLESTHLGEARVNVKRAGKRRKKRKLMLASYPHLILSSSLMSTLGKKKKKKLTCNPHSTDTHKPAPRLSSPPQPHPACAKVPCSPPCSPHGPLASFARQTRRSRAKTPSFHYKTASRPSWR